MQKISSVQHEVVKHLVNLRKDRAYRQSHQRVVIEGKKLVYELKEKMEFYRVFTSTIIDKNLFNCEVILVTPEILSKVCGSQAPETIIAEIALPQKISLVDCQKILVLENINDPGNLGTLLRTAAGFGWTGVFLLGACCDPFNDKALRAAKGATFHLAIDGGTWDDVLVLNHAQKWCLYAADLEGTKPETVDARKPLMLVLGSESHGISAQTARFCKKITLPTSSIESLNVGVAGGILMYLLRA